MHSLNKEQSIAASHLEGPLLVLAGAGSGKTRIVTYRIAHLLSVGIPSGEILAVTFTNKAAQEMRERILHLTQQSILACTFHSLCARILRSSIRALGFTENFTIYDEEDRFKLIKECLVELQLSEEKGLGKTLGGKISNAKNNLLKPEAFDKEDPQLAAVYKLYEKKLKTYDAVDFDDLLFLTVRLFEEHPLILERYQNTWTFLLIDEYQDTNSSQYRIIKLLSEKHHNVFAVGDPDQSIYSWRGANIQNILNFKQDFPGAKVVTLEQNYRSTSLILEAANGLIQHNTARYEKNLWSLLGNGEKIGLFIGESEKEEAAYVVKKLEMLHRTFKIPFQECAIFYRTHFQSRVFEDLLLKKKIPYQIIGGLSFYQTREVKDLIAFLRVIHSGSDFLSFARTINLPKRGLGEKFLTVVQEQMQEKQVTAFAVCEEILVGRGPKVSPKALEGLKNYVTQIQALQEMSRQKKPLSLILSSLVERFFYLNYLKEDPETYSERKENVDELIAKAAEWEMETLEPSLTAFLEELSLKSSADEKPPSQDALRLMTLHNSKGLEFKAVFLVGLEEELFPHINSLEDPSSIEEERRLCYVGMTRAKQHLFLSAAKTRYLWGVPRYMKPSRFLNEIPSQFFQKETPYTEISQEGSEESFLAGQEVFHKDFGAGIIQKAYKTSLGLTYDVFFPNSNTERSLVARFAKLVSK